jgi:hypothetical protein
MRMGMPTLVVRILIEYTYIILLALITNYMYLLFEAVL